MIVKHGFAAESEDIVLLALHNDEHTVCGFAGQCLYIVSRPQSLKKVSA
jgi:hypothetical protein